MWDSVATQRTKHRRTPTSEGRKIVIIGSKTSLALAKLYNITIFLRSCHGAYRLFGLGIGNSLLLPRKKSYLLFSLLFLSLFEWGLQNKWRQLCIFFSLPQRILCSSRPQCVAETSCSTLSNAFCNQRKRWVAKTCTPSAFPLVGLG